MNTQKIFKFLSIIMGALVFVAQGFYILNTNQTTTGQIIGYVNVIFFGGLILWALFKFFKRKKSNN